MALVSERKSVASCVGGFVVCRLAEGHVLKCELRYVLYAVGGSMAAVVAWR
jgi:hypothetical protein